MTLARNIQTMQQLAELKPRWYGEGQGIPIPPEVIEKTLRILHTLKEYQHWIYPTIDGNIQLEYDGINKSEYLEFLIKKDTIEEFGCDSTTENGIKERKEEQILSRVQAFYGINDDKYD